jgi:hypothetical protein
MVQDSGVAVQGAGAGALFYLCVSVEKEEKLSAASAGPGLTMPMIFDTWDDEGKR